MDRNINWNTNNAHRTSSTNDSDPRFRTSQVWLDEMNDSVEGTGVEIMELNSLDGSRSSQEDPCENIQNMSHMWSYANSKRLQDLEDTYKANRQARLKRRLRNKNLFTANDSFESEFGDSFYFNNKPDPSEEMITLNPEINCFTILNRHRELNLDSSSEDVEDEGVEATMCGDAVLETEWNGNRAYKEVVAYDSAQDGTKRTIWIYSFKNRRLLAENDFEVDNIPSQSFSRSTSCSPERVEEITTENVTHVGRVSSPIPKTYIPRLDLSTAATLPNVSEVTEPKSSHTLKQKYLLSQKPANGWIFDKADKLEEVSKQDKSTSVINWMALSPRERRRRSRHTNSDIQNMVQLLPVAEVVSYTEEKLQSIEHINTEITEDVISKAASPMNTQRTVTDSQTAINSVVESPVGDRGDYNKSLQIPHIKLGHKPLTPTAVITEPIEKLDSNCWIAEEEPKPRYELDPVPDVVGNQQVPVEVSRPCAGDKLMARNMALLKPAEWRAYSPIAGSRLSIQLSLGPDSEADRTSLLQRCINCFKCCKYRFH